MNYWGTMSANLAETFQAYLNYFHAYKPKAQRAARDYIRKSRPEALSADPAENGWILGTLVPALTTAGLAHSRAFPTPKRNGCGGQAISPLLARVTEHLGGTALT